MSLNIKHPEANKLARELSKLTHETITQAVIVALSERLLREQARRPQPHLSDEILKISKRCGELPNLDLRSPNEILGYDQHGLPG